MFSQVLFRFRLITVHVTKKFFVLILMQLIIGYFFRKMKVLVALAALLVGIQAVSFFDLVQEEWNSFKVIILQFFLFLEQRKQRMLC